MHLHLGISVAAQVSSKPQIQDGCLTEFIKQKASSKPSIHASLIQSGHNIISFLFSRWLDQSWTWLPARCVLWPWLLLWPSSTVGSSPSASWQARTSWGQLHLNEASGGTFLRGPSDAAAGCEGANGMTTQICALSNWNGSFVCVVTQVLRCQIRSKCQFIKWIFPVFKLPTIPLFWIQAFNSVYTRNTLIIT